MERVKRGAGWCGAKGRLHGAVLADTALGSHVICLAARAEGGVELTTGGWGGGGGGESGVDDKEGSGGGGRVELTVRGGGGGRGRERVELTAVER